jgi:hypothetical protein
MTDVPPLRGPPAFSNVRARRAERQGSSAPATSPIAEAIFGAVDKLLGNAAEGEARAHALQLAAIGLGLPYGDKHATIDQLKRLPQPYSTKLRFFTALVNAGELIEAQLILESIDALLEDAKTKPWLLEENQGEIDRWLLLLPFTSRPEATLEVLARLHAHIRLPWRLRPLLSALGFAPSDTAEQVLLGLAREDARFLSEHDWFAALEKRDTLSSLRILLDLISDGEAKGEGGPAGHLDVWPKACRWHAVAPRVPCRRVCASCIRRCAAGDGGPGIRRGGNARRGRRHAPCRQPCRDRKSIQRHARFGNRKSCRRAAAAVRLGQAHTNRSAHPRLHYESACSSYRARETRTESSLALACLVRIDELRDMHGVASGEPRHPDIATGMPWPTLLVQKPGCPRKTVKHRWHTP